MLDLDAGHIVVDPAKRDAQPATPAPTGVSVVILCGGRGSRLGESGADTPKALTPVNGRPILDYVSEHFLAQGFAEITLGTGHLSGKIESFAAERPRLQYKISNAGVEASMLQRLHHARSSLQENVLVAYGDTFIDMHYPTLIDFHRRGNAALTLVSGKIRNPFGVVSIGADNAVTDFVEKPVYDYYIGCFVCNRALLDDIPPSLLALPDGQGLVQWFQSLARAGKVQAYKHPGFQITFNTENERRAADRVLKDYFTVGDE